jgi:hypothetical protein
VITHVSSPRSAAVISVFYAASEVTFGTGTRCRWRNRGYRRLQVVVTHQRRDTIVGAREKGGVEGEVGQK